MARKQGLAIGIATAALVLAACSEGGEAAGGDTAGDNNSGVGSGDPLAGLSPEEMCSLVSEPTIAKASDFEVKDSKGRESAAGNQFHSVTCSYSLDFRLGNVDGGKVPGLTTSVSGVPGHWDVGEALDRKFTDLEDKVVDYEKVEGLGEGAGYGPNAKTGDVGGDVLTAVFALDSGQKLQVAIEVVPEAELDVMKPIATELIAGVEEKLG